MTSDFWQLLLVDILFLLLAGSMGLWFRSWLRREKRLLDDRLVSLETHQTSLERVTQRLQSACQRLESLASERGVDQASSAGSPGRYSSLSIEGNAAAAPPAPAVGGRSVRGVGRDEKEGLYDRAREMLARGKEPGAVARQLGLGIAEVELMDRILRQNTPK